MPKTRVSPHIINVPTSLLGDVGISWLFPAGQCWREGSETWGPPAQTMVSDIPNTNDWNLNKIQDIFFSGDYNSFKAQGRVQHG